MITLDELEIVSSVCVIGPDISSVEAAEQVYVLMKNYRDTGEDVYAEVVKEPGQLFWKRRNSWVLYKA